MLDQENLCRKKILQLSEAVKIALKCQTHTHLLLKEVMRRCTECVMHLLSPSPWGLGSGWSPGGRACMVDGRDQQLWLCPQSHLNSLGPKAQPSQMGLNRITDISGPLSVPKTTAQGEGWEHSVAVHAETSQLLLTYFFCSIYYHRKLFLFVYCLIPTVLESSWGQGFCQSGLPLHRCRARSVAHNGPSRIFHEGRFFDCSLQNPQWPKHCLVYSLAS